MNGTFYCLYCIYEGQSCFNGGFLVISLTRTGRNYETRSGSILIFFYERNRFFYVAILGGPIEATSL